MVAFVLLYVGGKLPTWSPVQKIPRDRRKIKPTLFKNIVKREADKIYKSKVIKMLPPKPTMKMK